MSVSLCGLTITARVEVFPPSVFLIVIEFLAPCSKPWWATLGYRSLVLSHLGAPRYDLTHGFWLFLIGQKSPPSSNQVGMYGQGGLSQLRLEKRSENAYSVFFYIVSRRAQQQVWGGLALVWVA